MSLSVKHGSVDASFVGVDLAWHGSGKNTGLAALRTTGTTVGVAALGSGTNDLNGVVQFIRSHESTTTVVAIDAPLIIRNATGQRPCETLISKRFGHADASCHTTNLARFPDAESVQLTSLLKKDGYRHCNFPDETWNPSGRWFFEVYPHPAQVVLFERQKIIKYKRGRVVERKAGLNELRREIFERMIKGDASIIDDGQLKSFLEADFTPILGKKLKHYEDALDALFCSFLAYYLWRWGWSRNDLFGDMASGYIVVPSAHLPSRSVNLA